MHKARRRSQSDNLQKKSDKKQAIKTRKHIDYILKYLKENNEVTAAEIAEKLGLSMDRTRVILKNMEEIETVGSNKTGNINSNRNNKPSDKNTRQGGTP